MCNRHGSVIHCMRKRGQKIEAKVQTKNRKQHICIYDTKDKQSQTVKKWENSEVLFDCIYLVSIIIYNDLILITN